MAAWFRCPVRTYNMFICMPCPSQLLLPFCLVPPDLKNIRALAVWLQRLDPKTDGASRDWVAIYDECSRILYQEIDYRWGHLGRRDPGRCRGVRGRVGTYEAGRARKAASGRGPWREVWPGAGAGEQAHP